MSVRKIIDLIVPLKSLSPRNLISLALVALFAFCYKLSGGTITTKPLKDLKKATAVSSFHPVIPANDKNAKDVRITGDIKQEVTTKDQIVKGEIKQNIEQGEKTEEATDQELESLKTRFTKNKKK